MPTLREVDPIAHALNRARDSEVARIAAEVGCSDSKVRSWRRGSLNVAPWIIDEIAKVLRLNDQVVEQHHQRRRRRQDEELNTRRELEAA